MNMETFRRDRLPFYSSLGFGLLAYGFCMMNKIPVGDDLNPLGLFGKGATTESGRYGLELLRLVMPDASMPWIYGLMSILLLSAAVCVTVRIFEIKSPVLQILLAGVFICFPAQAGTMLYMFTAAPYALALLLSVTGVWYFIAGGKGRWFVSPLLIGALYGLALLIASKLLGLPLLQEAVNESQSFPRRFLIVYSSWLKTFLDGRFGYVPNNVSRVMHLVLLLTIGFAGLLQLRKKGSVSCLLLAGLCLFLYPLSCYCLFLLADNSYIHSLSLYSFASLYVLCAALLDGWLPDPAPALRRLTALAMAVILCVNIFYANALYLRYYLRFEELKSFYTVLLTCVMETPGYAEGDRVAIVGDAPALSYDIDRHFTDAPLSLPSLELGATAYAEYIINEYLGCDIPFASEEEKARLETDDMPVYPYDGSVQKTGTMIVVKFSEKEADA